MSEESVTRRNRIEAALRQVDLWYNPATEQYEHTEETAADENWPCTTEDAAEETGLESEDLAWYEGLRRTEDR